MRPHRYLFYTMIHPIDGFEELRATDAGRVGYALIIVALWFLAVIAERQLTGASINFNRLDRLNAIVLLLRSGLLYGLWVVANWAFCTLLEGEGSFKNIVVATAYALLPFVIALFASTLISRLVTLDERVFVQWVKYVGMGWSGLLLVSGMKVIHGYTFPRTIASIILTAVGMVLIVFIFVLLFSLFQQLYGFVLTIFNEIMYRV